ncbi:hypothetical protein DB30_05204 [Enhygromyxa salina]|uniref:Uncharacterized protein n=1 Tax=Enhygromyxa salina TaxID=215803 RepID=A0A0C2CXS1_9BACT|nr:hypothetical protein DB30_05204 [Enhygromyxa salina]
MVSPRASDSSVHVSLSGPTVHELYEQAPTRGGHPGLGGADGDLQQISEVVA